MFPDRQWNADAVTTLSKKTDMTASIDRHRGVVIHTVCVYTCQHQPSWESHTQPRT